MLEKFWLELDSARKWLDLLTKSKWKELHYLYISQSFSSNFNNVCNNCLKNAIFDTWRLCEQLKDDAKACWLQHCSSSLEKLPAQKWLGSKNARKILARKWLDSKNARKILARNSTRLENFWLEMLEQWKFWLGPITRVGMYHRKNTMGPNMLKMAFSAR